MKSANTPPDEITCPFCGFRNRPSFRVCHGCAFPLRKGIKLAPTPVAQGISIHNVPLSAQAWLWLTHTLVLLLTLGLIVGLHGLADYTAGSARLLVWTTADPHETSPPAGVLTGITEKVSTNSMSRPILLPPAEGFYAHTSPITAKRPSSVGSPPAKADTLETVLADSSELSRTILAASQALSETIHIQRPYDGVITYTVQSDDTLYGLGQKFGLWPQTIYWANLGVLENHPNRLNVGTVLRILPVNGVYHIVSDGETVDSLAEEYGVKPKVLYNKWNDLVEGQALVAGTPLVVPGGQLDSSAWQLPPSAAGSSSVYQSVPGSCAVSYAGAPGRGQFDWPSADHDISGWYFHDRRNPSHIGLDIGLSTGDPVYAADRGVIEFAGWNSGYGQLVVINHLNGWQTWYGHLSQIDVACRQQVSVGSVIGLGGSTGWSSGPHLHFEMRLNGVPYDPLSYLP